MPNTDNFARGYHAQWYDFETAQVRGGNILKESENEMVFIIFTVPLIMIGLISVSLITGTWSWALYPGLFFIALIAATTLVLFSRI
ncbi:MAG: hypothetical protein V3T87_01535 [Candidatus Thorarchaeota archaeon]